MEREDEYRYRSTTGKRHSNKPYNDDYKDTWDDDLYDDDEFEDVNPDTYRRERRDYDRPEEYRRERSARREYARPEPRRHDRREEERREKEYRRHRREEERRKKEYQQERREEERLEKQRRRERKRSRRGGGCCLGGCLIPVLLMLAAIAAVVYLAVGAFAGRMRDAGFSKSSVQVNADMAKSTERSMKDYRNIMLFGVDARSQDPLAQGALADSCMLLSINKKSGEINLVSIYRDTYVETTDGSHMKLTEVYSTYGPKEMLQTINRNFDLNVKEYVTYTWAAVAHYIDGIGGMDLKITSAEAAGINKYIDEVIKNTGISSSHVSEDISSEGEVCHLDGVQAVTYCRLRKGLGDDYKRTERQRTVVSTAVSMAKHNPISAAASAYKVMPEIASNLKQGDILSLASGFPKYDLANTAGFPYNAEDTTIHGSSYLYAYTLIGNNRELHGGLFGDSDYEPSGTVEELHRKQGDIFGY